MIWLRAFMATKAGRYVALIGSSLLILLAALAGVDRRARRQEREEADERDRKNADKIRDRVSDARADRVRDADIRYRD